MQGRPTLTRPPALPRRVAWRPGEAEGPGGAWGADKGGAQRGPRETVPSPRAVPPAAGGGRKGGCGGRGAALAWQTPPLTQSMHMVVRFEGRVAFRFRFGTKQGRKADRMRTRGPSHYRWRASPSIWIMDDVASKKGPGRRRRTRRGACPAVSQHCGRQETRREREAGERASERRPAPPQLWCGRCRWPARAALVEMAGTAALMARRAHSASVAAFGICCATSQNVPVIAADPEARRAPQHPAHTQMINHGSAAAPLPPLPLPLPLLLPPPLSRLPPPLCWVLLTAAADQA